MAKNLFDYWLNLKYRLAQIPNYSIISLIVFNAIPLFGTLFWNWNVGTIMGLYWFENIVIGIFNVFRMLWVGYFGKENFLVALFLIPFFVLHYGIFTFGHGVFVYHMFMLNTGFGGSGSIGSGPLSLMSSGLALAMILSVASHGVSFIVNFIGRKEYENVKLQKLLFAPYKRIIILHIAIIIGGFILISTGSSVKVVALLVVLKIGFDLQAHLKEHIQIVRIDKVRHDGNDDFYDDQRYLKEQNPNIKYK